MLNTNPFKKVKTPYLLQHPDLSAFKEPSFKPKKAKKTSSKYFKRNMRMLKKNM